MLSRTVTTATAVAKLEIEQFFFAISLTGRVVALSCDGGDPVAFFMRMVRGGTVAGLVQWLSLVVFVSPVESRQTK